MENKKNIKKVIDGEKHHNLNEVHEDFYELAREEPEAGENGVETHGVSTLPAQKDSQFQAGSGLEEIIKLLVKISQPPNPLTPSPMDETGAATEPENGSEAVPELPEPEAIRPSSSGWALWLVAIILAAFYFLSWR